MGGVALLRLRPELDEFEEEIGRLLLEFYRVKAVYRIYGVTGVERKPIVKHLAGEEVREIVHREYGYRFKLDLTRLMLCLGNSFERLRVAALTRENGSIEKMCRDFDERRKFLVEELNKIPHVSCTLPKGAFYTMANVGYYIQNNTKGIVNTGDFCIYLLEKVHIAVVTGSAFGMENYVRFSYANSMQNLREGLKRFRNGLESLII